MDKAEDCRVLRVVPEEGYGEGIFRIADIRTNSIGYASLRRYQSYTRAPADLVCLVARRARNLHSPEKFIRSLNTEGHRKHVNSFLRGFSIPSRESRRDTPESYLGTFAFSFFAFFIPGRVVAGIFSWDGRFSSRTQTIKPLTGPLVINSLNSRGFWTPAVYGSLGLGPLGPPGTPKTGQNCQK